MTIEQVIARIERARSIYENAIDSDIVKGRVAMCNDIVNTLRLETEFHPNKNSKKLPEGLEEAAEQFVGYDMDTDDLRDYELGIVAFKAGAEWMSRTLKTIER